MFDSPDDNDSPGRFTTRLILTATAALPVGVLLAAPVIISLTIIVQMLCLQDMQHEDIHILGRRD